MGNWSGWDWIGYVCFGISAASISIIQATKDLQVVPSWLPNFLLSSFFNYIPAIFFVFGSLVFLFFSFSSKTNNEEWNKYSHLSLAFDQNLQNASALTQDGIRFYYWMNIPGIGVDFEKRSATPTIGYVLIFITLKDPSSINYNKINVVGGGVNCELLYSNPTGAVVRIMGDIRGRTLDIRFSEKPIPL